MKVDSKLAKMIKAGDFIITAECAPGATASGATAEAALKALGDRPVAVNVADNSHGVALSSLAASVTAVRSGIEPVLQMVTRDRNRIALQSDLLGAAMSPPMSLTSIPPSLSRWPAPCQKKACWRTAGA